MKKKEVSEISNHTLAKWSGGVVIALGVTGGIIASYTRMETTVESNKEGVVENRVSIQAVEDYQRDTSERLGRMETRQMIQSEDTKEIQQDIKILLRRGQ